MNKFTITEVPKTDETKPVLYKVLIGNMYYLHKGKKLEDSANKFLDDVYRGMRGLKFPPAYQRVVDYCNKYPAIHKVGLDVVLNAEPGKVLRREDAMYKVIGSDPESLNDPAIEPYKPEWMLKEVFQGKCDKCITSGFIHPDPQSKNPCYAKKQAFKFCPNCGRLNRNKSMPKSSFSKNHQ
jgi:hypothetical protein